jgi:hypothetical protein
MLDHPQVVPSKKLSKAVNEILLKTEITVHITFANLIYFHTLYAHKNEIT